MISNKAETRRRYISIGIAVAVVAAIVLLSKIGVFGKLMDVFKPILYGVILAYILWPIIEILENKAFNKIKSKKLIRALSLVITYAIFLALITLLISGIIPQLGESLNMFQGKFSGYLETIQNFIDKLPESKFAFLANYQEDLASFITNAVSWMWTGISGVLSNATGYVLGIFSEVKNLFFALCLSIYFLLYKEKLFAQIRKLVMALFSDKTVEDARHYVDLVDHSFGGFIKGSILDSLIVGVVCAICMWIFRIPYVLLISIVIGVTNLIPVIGPIIGSIPCGIILLIVQPDKTLLFIVMIIVMQQIDGNVIKPKILSGLTSLNALWIMIAVTVMSGLLGVFGMFLGVPTFAVFYDIVKEIAEKRLTGRELSTDTNDYYADPQALAITEKTPRDEEKIKQHNEKAKSFKAKVMAWLVNLLLIIKEGWRKFKAWLSEKAKNRAQKEEDEDYEEYRETRVKDATDIHFEKVRPSRSERHRNRERD